MPSTRLSRVFTAGRISGLPRSFWVVFAGQLINRVGSMAVPFLVLFLRDQGMTAQQSGAVLGAVGVGGLVSQPLGGLLTDRWGPRRALVTGLCSGSVMIALLGLVRGLPLILCAACLLGVVADVYRPAAAAVVSAVVPAKDRPRAFSLVYWAVNLGVALGGLVSGILAGHGYWTLFIAQAVTMAAFAAVAASLLPRDRPPAGAVRPGAPRGSSGVLRDRLLLALTGLNLLNGLVSAQITVGLPLAISDDGLGTSLYGAVFLASGVLIGLTQPPLSARLERYDRVLVLSVSWLVFALGIAATGLADTAPVYLATVCVWTAGEIGAASFVGSLVADLAPPHAQGRYQATFGWSYGAAQFVGPPLGAWLYATAGPNALWVSCAALGVAGLAGGLALIRPVRHRLTPLPSSPVVLQKAL
ncbi:MFS transporter [Streptomyces sp. NPDC048111]|uniref:MFS transporter n=1 Tax=Streptomyces sp. NPDC048111 TaxID=3365500 RepID=UPI00371BB36D